MTARISQRSFDILMSELDLNIDRLYTGNTYQNAVSKVLSKRWSCPRIYFNPRDNPHLKARQVTRSKKSKADGEKKTNKYVRETLNKDYTVAHRRNWFDRVADNSTTRHVSTIPVIKMSRNRSANITVNSY
ncbi:unnamed protein product [Owenia fusiformis]|uniref:Uncharacterized protein n=1 Tax=Owenia fusiformis TaxID=6347 RepID=A0A8J1TB56_OWEFU|nr:unnamed protein product [Owenia fusiformis]